MTDRFLFILILLTSISTRMNAQHAARQYATVNGLTMYYELHGAGYPLVVIHGNMPSWPYSPGGHDDYIGEVCAPDKQSHLPDAVADIILTFLRQP